MKQRTLISFIGTVCVFMSTLFMMTGCPHQQNPKQDSSQDKKPKKQIFTITYDFPDCTSAADFSNDWKLKPQTVKEGEEITLAKDGSESTSGKPWKIEYVKHKNSKVIKGWSKNKNSETPDYTFGEKIKPTGNMTLYPALSKYGIGDVIDGKTVIYVRNGTKDKIRCRNEDKEYSVIGTDWRYIAVDADAAKNSEKRQWSSTAKSIITSDAIGAGKGNTAKILSEHSTDTDADNAAKHCKKISADSYLPSEAEIFLIHNAICDGKITGLPTSVQTETLNLGPQFGSKKNAYFWTSTQQNKDNAYAVSLYKYDGIWGGEKDAKSKTEAVAERKAAYVCPIIYYDDNGKALD